MDRRSHWEGAYRRLGPDRVGWSRPRLDASLRLIAEAALPANARIVDVGGGASTLADHLRTREHRRVTVLDLSATALEIARQRLSPTDRSVHWIVADALSVPLRPGSAALWHDRAVYHFLVEEEDRERYRTQLLSTLEPAGQVVLGAFSPEAPDRCSGLPVRRTTSAQLAEDLAPDFALAGTMHEDHTTPGGTSQPYVFCRFVRID